MQPIRHILVPTDFGPAATNAAEHAIALATKSGAKITLLHVYPLPVYAYADAIVWPMAEIESAARKALEDLGAGVKKRWAETRTVLAAGNPWEAILAAIKAEGVDLVVMGTHGRHGLSRALLGSVAEKVVRLAEVPVLTVHEAAPSGAEPRSKP